MNDTTIALVQFNPAVGALEHNATSVILRARDAAAQGANLVVFPELCMCGYPPEDLILKTHFIEDCAKQLDRIAAELPPDIICVIGAPTAGKQRPRNSAVIYSGGRKVAIYDKQLLPNYGVFDEKRVFEPGNKQLILQVGDLRFALNICEDSWFQEQHVEDLRTIGIHGLLNLSASPYHRGKLREREAILQKTAQAAGAPLFYTNLVGGQDELVFDGASMVVDPTEGVIARARQFESDILYFTLPTEERTPALAETAPPPHTEFVILEHPDPTGASTSPNRGTRITPPLAPLAEIYAALTLGLKDYVEKSGFNEVVIAISGGIDSALAATIAVDALGADRVRGITMPSQYSSDETLGDAGLLAEYLGIHLDTIPIQPFYDLYMENLAPLWPGKDPDTTEENLQARIRGNLVMALSNKFGALVVATGNKSELATGYCTLYGDMCGGFAVIKDVPKTIVFELCRWKNEDAGKEIIPVSTIDRPPSAELRPDQKDSDSLPPYEVLDGIIERYVEGDQGLADIVSAGYPADIATRIIRLIDLNEYKRRQAPPGVKITPKAFGKDRRMPIINRYRKHAS
jgi:NAD+ synthase (glutamine-hydrolysing)